MGELDIRLLLRQLRLKPEDTEDMERELVEWYKEWHTVGRPRNRSLSDNQVLRGTQ